jgi:hypothetical protein
VKLPIVAVVRIELLVRTFEAREGSHDALDKANRRRQSFK